MEVFVLVRGRLAANTRAGSRSGAYEKKWEGSGLLLHDEATYDLGGSLADRQTALQAQDQAYVETTRQNGVN